MALRVARSVPLSVNDTGDPSRAPRRATSVAPSAMSSITTSNTFGSPEPPGTAQQAAESRLVLFESRREAKLDRAAPALPAVHERLRKRSHDHRLGHARGPAPVIPPGDIAGAELYLGRPEPGLDAVHEEEPVLPLGEIPLDALDRLDEAAAVARLDVRLAVESLEDARA